MDNKQFLLGVDIGGTKCAVTMGRRTADGLDIVDKMAEVRRNAQSVYCAKNPGCPRKKVDAKIETKKIELD